MVKGTSRFVSAVNVFTLHFSPYLLRKNIAGELINPTTMTWQRQQVQDEAGAHQDQQLRCWLHKRDSWEQGVHRAIDECAHEGGGCDVVRDGGVM